MALVTMKEMLNNARKEKYAIGAFEFWSYDSARAVVKSAKELNVPAILQVGGWEKDFMDGYKNVVSIVKLVSDFFDHPVAIHLDHSESIDEIKEALDAGFTSVMIDASAHSYEKNVEMTSEVVRIAKSYGASVEAELGKLAGNEGNIANEEDEQTNPEQAAAFVDATGIDALAVAIGTAHGFYTKPPVLNIKRLEEISDLVKIPLVLHGGSGTPEDMVAEAVKRGIAKVNICTEFIAAYGTGYKAQDNPGFKYNVNSLFRAGMDCGAALAKSKMNLFLGK